MDTKDYLLPDDLMLEIMKAAKAAAKAVRDPLAMEAARDRMFQMREEIYRRHGLLDIGVPALRELRDGTAA